ncbi:MAG: class IV adenylate cyclase [Planctomycetota bacterium]|jgi:adenylate cyclase class IV
MQSIDFKAELRDIDAARAQCRALDGRRLGVLRQTDTYYRMIDGRLKQRRATGERTEWIYYHRPDRVTPRMCNYTVLTDPQARRRWGTRSLTPWLVVRKLREVWMTGQVRIHLDEVDDVGRFLEIEAPVTRSLDVRACHRVIDDLREAFAPALGEAIAVSYADLMEQVVEQRRRDEAGGAA